MLVKFVYSDVEDAYVRLFREWAHNDVLLVVNMSPGMEDSYRVRIEDVVPNDDGKNREEECYTVRLLGEYRPGTVGLRELATYLHDGCVRVVSLS